MITRRPALGHQALSLIRTTGDKLARQSAKDLVTVPTSTVIMPAPTPTGQPPSCAVIIATLSFLVYHSPDSVRARELQAESARAANLADAAAALSARSAARARVEARTVGLIEPESLRERGMPYVAKGMKAPEPFAGKLTQDDIDRRK